MIEVSIIIPILNEENNITNIYNTISINDNISKEIIFCDGGSTDESIKIISLLSQKDSSVILLHNSEKYVSSAFNSAFKISTGNYIALLGAHTLYPPNYIETALWYLKNEDCDVVGGPIKHIGKSNLSKAIAYCMSCVFGVGNTSFRTTTEKQYVETVPFPVYKKMVFEKAGLFSTDLIRNQDDDFHYRLNELGFKILMVPELTTKYLVRDNFFSFIKQYFQYGFYKPLVLKNNKKSVRIRHLVPSFFSIYFFIILLSRLFNIDFLLNWLLLFPFLVYIILNLFFAFKNENKISIKINSFFIFFILHLSYGLGFILGVLSLKK